MPGERGPFTNPEVLTPSARRGNKLLRQKGHWFDDENLDLLSRLLTRDDVYLADEAFFTGTAAEVTPVRELDDRVIGAGQRGPVTERLQKAFFDVVNGKNREFSHWLTPV